LRDYGAKGQIGLEKTPADYVAKMVSVFDEVRRVLRDDGTLWLNLGDSYNQGAKGAAGGVDLKNGARRFGVRPTERGIPGLKAKDLIGIPWMVAFALREAGWYLRAAIPWIKRNPMPESVEDRPSVAHEFVFLLSKSDRYFYDAEAVRVRLAESSVGRADRKARLIEETGVGTLGKQIADGVEQQHGYAGLALGRNGNTGYNHAGRNRRTSDWFFDSLQAILDGDEGLLHDEAGQPVAFVVNLRSYKGAHFATFPERLVRPMIQAGTSENGCCPTCGAPWRRVIERERKPTRPGTDSKVHKKNNASEAASSLMDDRDYRDYVGNRDPQRHVTETRTTGWEKPCPCPDAKPIPCAVLDPFNGAGTSALVALQLGCEYYGIDLNESYLELTRERIKRAGLLDRTLFSEPA
jgi:hypothetical protein